jgi:hypothetical protein
MLPSAQGAGGFALCDAFCKRHEGCSQGSAREPVVSPDQLQRPRNGEEVRRLVAGCGADLGILRKEKCRWHTEGRGNFREPTYRDAVGAVLLYLLVRDAYSIGQRRLAPS